MRAGGSGIVVDELKGIARYNAGLRRSTFHGQFLLVESDHVWVVMKMIVEGDGHPSSHVLRRLKGEVVSCCGLDTLCMQNIQCFVRASC